MVPQHSASLVHESPYIVHATQALFTHTSEIVVLPGARQHGNAPAAVEQESPRATQVWVQTLLVHASSPQHWFAPNPVGQAIPRAMQLLHR